MEKIARFPLRVLSGNLSDSVPEMQKAGPLVEVSIPIIGKPRITTTQALATAILKNDSMFRQRSSSGHVAGLRWWMPRSIRVLTRNMLTMDGEEHRRLRSMVDAAFQRRNIAQMEPRIGEIADELLAAIDPNKPVDLIEAYASVLPLAVICELLGLPAEDRTKFMHWASGFTSAGSLFGFIRVLPKIRALERYMEQAIERIEREGGEGLIAELIAEFGTADKQAREELVAMGFLLLVAGHQTTTHLISGGVLALLDHPEQKERFISDPESRPMAVEECLRYVSPVLLTKPRIAAENTEVAGCPVKRDDMFMPFIGAANRDPEVFENPEAFDISRRPNRHIAFGTGVHFCLGHQLARIEAKVALEKLFTAYPQVRLAVPRDQIAYHQRTGLRAMKELPVRFVD